MAAPDKLLRVPGTLVKSPTDVGAANAGGTVLGMVRDVVLVIASPFFEIIGEDYGPEEWAEIIELGGRAELRCSLRDWDDDAFGTVFPNTVAGDGGRTGMRMPDTSGSLPGDKATDRAVKILYFADNAAAPSIYLRSAMPIAARRVEVPLGHTDDALWAVRFVGRRDPTTQTGSFQWQILEDIVL